VGIRSRGVFHLTVLGICPEEVRKSRKPVIQVHRPKFEGFVSREHCNLNSLITYVRDYEINKV
jgi:hypothetical protein